MTLQALRDAVRNHNMIFYTEDDANFCVDSRYRIVEILGKGSYGTVCSALDMKSPDKDPQKVAIKKISKIFSKEVLMKRAIRELKLMRHFRGHRNIANLIDSDIVYIKPYQGLYCIQEYVEIDLAKVIYSSIQFSEFHIQSFCYQIACAVNYIHSADVIHRDLKPGNVLVSSQGTLKVCDFGLARGISPKFFKPKTNYITNYVATRWYRAPELILSDQKYTKAVDLWAVGCILAELYGRRPLFPGKDQVHQLQEIVRILGTPATSVIRRLKWNSALPPNPQYRSARWKDLYPFASADAIQLIFSLLQWDPAERLSVEETLEDRYFDNIRDPSSQSKCESVFDFSFEYTSTTMDELTEFLESEVSELKKERNG